MKKLKPLLAAALLGLAATPALAHHNANAAATHEHATGFFIPSNHDRKFKRNRRIIITIDKNG